MPSGLRVFRLQTPDPRSAPDYIRCAVCHAWNDAQTLVLPETTATVYQADPDDGVVRGFVPAGRGCWFCGTPRVYDGQRGSL
jgi:hypothetical protein